MAIKFNCPHCQMAYSVRDALAGKKAACKRCKQEFVIPNPAAAPAAAPAEDVEALAAAALVEPRPAGTTEAPRMVDFDCPQCGEHVSLPIEFAGKNAPCPNPECRRIVRVPMPKIKDPADWRKKDEHIPSGARRDTAPVPEGAWDATKKMVSAEALNQAGVIPKKKRPGLTTRQKVYRGIGIGAGVLVAVVGGVFAYSAWSHEKQDAHVERAVKLAEADEAKAKEPAAAVSRAAGEYYLRCGTRDSAEKAQKHFAKARALLIGARPGPERDLLLTDLALAQVDLAGSDKEAQAGTRLKADAAKKELSQTLSHFSSAAGRLRGLGLVARKLIAQGRASEATALANQPPGTRAEGGDAEAQAYEAPEALALVGLELYLDKQQDAAAKLAAQALALYPTAAGEGNAPAVAPSLVALCVRLGKPEPKPGKAPEEAERAAIGRAVAQALGAPADKRPPASPEGRLRAAVAVADVTMNHEPHGSPDENGCAGLLETEFEKQPATPWPAFRCVELHLLAPAPDYDRLMRLTERVSDPALRGRARLDVYRARVAAKDKRGEAIDAAPPDELDTQPLIQGLAREALARARARHEGGGVKAAEGLEPPLRPFGLVGAVLGEQDAKGK